MQKTGTSADLQCKSKIHRLLNFVDIGAVKIYHLLSCAGVLHCENPLKVEDDWIKDYALEEEI